MAGHNKWSKVKRLKGALDAKRGKIFSALSKEISVSAKSGGGDPAMNPRLRSAILAARAQNMPNDNIERAIKRGTGEIEGQHFEELVYEGYAPGGVALVLEVATDNKNRTAADLRLIFSKHNGNLASSGSVSYMFHKKGQILISSDTTDEDRLLEAAIDLPVLEMSSEDGQFQLLTAADQLYAVAEALRERGLVAESQKLTYIPDNTVLIQDEAVAAQVIRLCDALEDCDDVQNVYSNFDAPEELLARLSN